MKKYEVLLFDVDGTLLDFDRAEEQGIAALMRHFGVPVTEEHTRQYHLINKIYWERFERGEVTRDQVLSLRFEDFFGNFGIRVDGMDVDRLYREHLDNCAFLIDGAIEILKYLRPEYKMYVITNGVAQTQYKRLAASGLDKFFDGIFISEEAGAQKPMPEFFEYCFEKMGRRDTENMLVIGDSLTSDIRGGNASGIDTLWYNPGGLKNTAGVHVDMEIRSLGELKLIL